jgi:hypothetical protein
MPSVPSPASSIAPSSERRRHWEMLIIAFLVLLGACSLEVRDDEHVALHGFAALVLPPLCGSRAWFGVECPGCGLTRSIVQLAHGDLEGSLARHRLGLLFAGAILLQFPYRITALVRQGHNPVSPFFRKAFANTLIALLLGNWMLHILGI